MKRLSRIAAGLRLDRPTTAVIVCWALVMIATPIFFWTGGKPALHAAINAGVLFQVAAVLTALLRAGDARRAAWSVPLILALAWLAEFIGHSTGFPFGAYDYTPVLQPQLGGVPLLIPLAWLMMLPPAWAVAALLVPGRSPWRAMVAALAFTAWDLFLDPQMVGWGFWRWEVPGIYFGIPLANFLGWLLVSFLVSWLFMPDRLPGALLLIYVVTWSLQTIGQLFFWQLPGPALFGFAGMGLFILLAGRALVRQEADG